MKRRAFLKTVPGLAVATGVSGCLDGRRNYDVGMQSNAFVPSTIEVSVGEEVVWENTGSRNHTVTAYQATLPEGAEYFSSGEFDSEQAARDSWIHQIDGGGVIRPGGRYTHVFEVPGEFQYFCIPHEPAGMVGTVVVSD